MYASGPAHNLLICNDDLSFRWFVSQPADIYVSCTKGTEFYLCTLTICIFSLGKTHTEKKKTQNPQVKDFRGYSGVFLLATRWCRVPTKMDMSLPYWCLHYPGRALTAWAFIAQQQRMGISAEDQTARPSCQLLVGRILYNEARGSSI